MSKINLKEQIWAIEHMRMFMNPGDVNTMIYSTTMFDQSLVTELVTSRLDYCNFFFQNIALEDITKLQKKVQGVQNCLSRVLTTSPRFTCVIMLFLKRLHWFPV